jgi:serine-type D-Ala-D-Ala carboxypeptidase/endopeptidase
VKNDVRGLAVFFAFISIAGAQVHRARYIASQEEIRAILEQRVKAQRQSTGIVVGLVDATGQRIVNYPQTLTGETLFEIGSLTKVFTALLLSDMVQRGEAALSDPVSKYLPPGVKAPNSITLEDLATHTSGLPRMPSNFTAEHYTREMLFDFVSSFRPGADANWKYSNLGYGLLGQALARDYESAIRARITAPLNMADTGIALQSEEQLRLAIGHDDRLQAVPASNFGALAPAAGLRSSANDLLKFLSAFLGYTKTPLAPAMARMLNVRRATSEPGLTSALGWEISMPDGWEIVWKDGITPGYSSFLGYNTRARVGVVVLSNTSTARGVSDIGMYILDGASPLFRGVR